MARVERALHVLATLLTLTVLVGFGLFAVDQASDASKRQRAIIADARRPDPTAAAERAREREHTSLREVIDDVNDVLLKPFASIVDGVQSRWARRSLAGLMALMVYGFGGAYLARFARGRT
jgi:hypothetical protein